MAHAKLLSYNMSVVCLLFSGTLHRLFTLS